jgi:hypothetical protein
MGLKGLREIDLIVGYKNGDEKCFHELLRRHDSSIKRAAGILQKTWPTYGNSHDFYTEFVIGMSAAYLNFNVESWTLHSKMGKEYGVLSYVMKKATMVVKTNLWEKAGLFKMYPSVIKYRSYFSGKYDDRPEYKKEFEKKYGLDTIAKRSKVRAKYEPLLYNFEYKHGGLDNGDILEPKDNSEEGTRLSVSEKNFSELGEDFLCLCMDIKNILTDLEYRVFELYFVEKQDKEYCIEILKIEKTKLVKMISLIREKIKNIL